MSSTVCRTIKFMIDYRLLNEALQYYLSLGYEYIEVPWIVDIQTQLITCPSEDMIYKTTGGGLVGSAEQGFIKLLLDNTLDYNKKYCAITPCFRLNDSRQGIMHKEYFIKLELFSCTYNYSNMQWDAYRLFDKYLRKYDKLSTSFDHNSSDINLNGVEIGSYGRRKLNDDVSFQYGTGIALPRFNMALNYNGFLV